MRDIDTRDVETPAFVVSRGALEKNLKLLARVQEEAGCTILLALKGFAMWAVADQVRRYLPGVSASSPHEARLGKEEFRGQVHTYAPAYADADFPEILGLSDHVIFNSFSQWDRLRPIAEAHRAAGGADVKFGIRLNPGYSEVEVELYDPCATGSRLGAPLEAFRGRSMEGLSGLHFHSLCEQGSDVLERTLAVVEKNFAEPLAKVEWVNFGGGHHITRADYDVERLVRVVKGFRERHGVEVFLEPGEAIGLGTGVLVSRVLDLTRNGGLDIAILDISVTDHMPDCLEMPYRPEIAGAADPGVLPHTYRLGGLSCLAGDVVGDYSFDAPLEVGQRIVFMDMAHYTMVKTTTFNGVRLPDIATYEPSTGAITVHRRFGYPDYRDRLS